MIIKRNILHIYLLAILIINSAFIPECTPNTLRAKQKNYKLKDPSEIFKLKKSLSEISGISFVSDTIVALIQDEKGEIFFLNLFKDSIVGKEKFAKEGDFEDLKILGDTAYMLRSDGKLYELKEFENDTNLTKAIKINTGLKKENNTEGLCWDDKRKLFLIACKGSPDYKTDYKGKKAIYTFDPVTNKLSEKADMLIDERQIEKFAYSKNKNFVQQLMKFYVHNSKEVFEPSGIAIQPFSRDIYVISSVGKILVILDKAGQIKEVIRLPGSIFKQPEGIAFDSQGNLYISNEGRKGKGDILKFNYQKI